MIRYTQLKSTDRKVLREVLPLAKPFTVLIEPTGLCNFRCIQCFQSLKDESYFTRTRAHMPLERFRKTVNQLREWPGERIKVLKLSLYGEPLLTPDFAEMLKIAREADVADRIETTSNVSLLTPEIARAMIEQQLDYLRVSIYAANPERFHEVTGSALDPARIHDNLAMLRDLKKQMGSERPFVSVKMLDSFDEENERFLNTYNDVADELYLDKPHGWINVPGGGFVEKLYKDKTGEAARDRLANSTERVACPMAFTTMTVRANGDVSPCCVDFIGGTNLGNMETATLREIWESESWYRFQKLQLTGWKSLNHSCARCDIYLSDHYTRDNIDGFPAEKLLWHKLNDRDIT